MFLGGFPLENPVRVRLRLLRTRGYHGARQLSQLETVEELARTRLTFTDCKAEVQSPYHSPRLFGEYFSYPSRFYGHDMATTLHPWAPNPAASIRRHRTAWSPWLPRVYG